MSIKTKLSYVFIVVFGLMVIMAAASYTSLKTTLVKLNYDIPHSISTLAKNLRLTNNLNSIRYYDELLFSSLANYIYSHDEKWLRKYYAHENDLDLSQNEILANDIQGSFGSVLISQSQKSRKHEQLMIKLCKSGNWQEAKSLFEGNQYGQERRIFQQAIADYMNSFSDGGQASILAINLATKETRPILRKNLQINLVILVILLIVVTGLTILIERQIIRPLEAFVKVADELAKGQRKHELTISSNDEIGKLALAFNNLTKELELTTVSRDTLMIEIEKRSVIENELRKRSQDLERSNRDLEQFAYVASHDLQEPLRTVSTYLELITRKFHKEGMSNEETKYIGYIIDGTKRMKELISGLLAFSRVGRSEELHSVNLEEAIQSLLSSLDLAIKESGAVIKYSNLLTISANKNEIYQLLQNLIGNALKFRGEMRPVIEINAVDEDGFWKFSIRDNGIGIKEEYYEKIFVIFQRLHEREEYEGTGIGLAVCKKIVERHRGRIWVESKLGEGTCFHFTIAK